MPGIDNNTLSDKLYSDRKTLAVTLPRENGRTTFCRQFTYNPKGAYNSRRDGAIVSGTPVAGMPISELPVGSKIALTDPAKLSPNEVGYIVVGMEPQRALITPDAHQKSGSATNADTIARDFIADMVGKASQICQVVAGCMTISQLGNDSGALEYFRENAQTKRAFWTDYWTASSPAAYPSLRIYVQANGALNTGGGVHPSQSKGLRPLLSIPVDTLVLPTPNPSGAYELA